MLLLFYYGLKYIYNFSAVCMSCIIPTRPSKPAVSVYILLFHQFIDFNSCVLNSNLNLLFKEVSGSANNGGIASQELTNIEMTFTVPNGYKIHSVKQLVFHLLIKSTF